jgi:hypothetical protein
VSVKDNKFYAVLAPNINLNAHDGGTRRVTATGNRFETVGGYPAVGLENGASASEITLSGNSYCGVAAMPNDTNPLLVC